MTELTPEALAILAEGAPKPQKAGALQTIGAVVGLTLVALGGGGALGYFLQKAPAPAAPADVPAAAGEAAAEAAVDPVAPKETLQPLEPMLTDLASPPGTQVRMEAGLLLRLSDDESADQAALAAQVQADTVVFLRTLDLAQIEGARGLLHLKEDLLERARMRSPAVSDIVVRSLIVK